ncbi:hypothetical protein EG831_10200, partial [bacterium]|nr:hypothetical protein [bacterium]
MLTLCRICHIILKFLHVPSNQRKGHTMPRSCRFLLAALLTAALCGGAMAATHQYTGLWGKPGINVVSSTKGGVEIVYSLDEVEISDLDINGETMQAVNIGGLYLPNQSGAPNLPSFSRIIAVPQGATATVELLADLIQNGAESPRH